MYAQTDNTYFNPLCDHVEREEDFSYSQNQEFDTGRKSNNRKRNKKQKDSYDHKHNKLDRYN